MRYEPIIKQAMKDKAPSLHRQMTAAGTLDQYAADLADQMADEIVTLTQEQRAQGKWDKMGPMVCAGKMAQAASLNRERVFAEMLEFPLDETSLPGPAATTSLAPTI